MSASTFGGSVGAFGASVGAGGGGSVGGFGPAVAGAPLLPRTTAASTLSNQGGSGRPPRAPVVFRGLSHLTRGAPTRKPYCYCSANPYECRCIHSHYRPEGRMFAPGGRIALHSSAGVVAGALAAPGAGDPFLAAPVGTAGVAGTNGTTAGASGVAGTTGTTNGATNGTTSVGVFSRRRSV